MSRHFFPALLLGTVSIACIHVLPPPANEDSPFKGIAVVDSYQNGLTNEERAKYYHADEGIQYLPIDILMSLNRPVMPENGSISLDLYDQLLLEKPERIGLYPDFLKPGGPPIGITVSDDPTYLPMAGVNCATCHTTVLANGGKGILVDGGSSLFAIDRFISEMVFSLVYTALSPTEFHKMYDRYRSRHVGALALASNTSAVDELADGAESDALEKEAKAKLQIDEHEILDEAQALLAKVQAKADEKADDDLTINRSTINSPLTASGAYPTAAELDTELEAYAYVVKRIIFFAGAAQYASGGSGSPGLGRSNPWSVTKNMLAANAASLNIGIPNKGSGDWLPNTNGSVNTPNIWGFSDNKWIFWTGVTNSMTERNFAQGIALITDFDWKTYETTVSVAKLHDIQSKYSDKITSPVWPSDLFGTPDAALAERGKVIFKATCLGCHSPKNVEPGPGGTEQQYGNVSTDRAYYAGQTQSFYGKNFFTDVLAPWLSAVKSRAYVRENVPDPDRTGWEAGRLPSVWRSPGVNEVEAKSLWGIWATAPFLHNGAVASIRELLTPPAKRLQSFWVGNPTFDPKSLGFKADKLYYTSQIVATVAGNSTDGHAIGVDLPDTDKDALIEFLKVYSPTTKFE